MWFRPPGFFHTNVAALYGAVTGGADEAETTTLVAAMSVDPGATRKGHINTLIKGLKDNGIWSKLDAIWVPRAHDAQAGRLNWKTPASFALTAVNSPAFTTDRGYTGGGTSYLDTNFIPNTHGVQYALNSASLGAYLTPSIGADTQGVFVSIGSLSPGTGANIQPFRDTSARTLLNDTEFNNTSGTITTRYGLSAVNRSSVGSLSFFRDGTLIGTKTANSSSRPTQSLFILGLNNAGVFTNGLNNQVGMAFVGGSLTDGDHATLDTLWDSYVSATT